MNQPELMKKWYSKSTIIYEIVYNFLGDRETAFLRPKHTRKTGGQNYQDMFRDINIYTPQGFNYYLDQLFILETDIIMNCYYSLAKYKEGVPKGNKSLKLKNEEQKKWKDTHHYHMISYDLLIDIDSPDHENMSHAKHATKKVIEYLDENLIPYYLRFSGMGYHIVIPHEAFEHLSWHFNPDKDQENSIYSKYNQFTQYLHDNISELVDTDLHDCRRITKVPYSLVFYQRNTYVCWPFKTKKEFMLHKYRDFQLLNQFLRFSGFQNCFKRGQTLFNEQTWRPEYTTKLLKRMKVIKDGEEKKDVGR